MTIAMPYKIGCVRGGANWDEVYAIIQEVFKCSRQKSHRALAHG